MSNRAVLLLFAALFAVTLAAPGQQVPAQTLSQDPSDWPMYNHDVLGTRFNSGEHKLNRHTVHELTVRWVFQTAGDVYATPAVVGGIIYAGDTSGAFYALAQTGQLIWRAQVDAPVTASALVSSSMVFFGDQAGYIHGLDRTTGRILWSTQADQHLLTAIYSSPIWVDGDIVIGVSSNEDSYAAANPGYPCCSFRGSVLRIRSDTGAIAWKTYVTPQGTNGVSVWSTPTYDAASGLVFVTTGNNYSAPASSTSDAFLALDSVTGAIRWTHQMIAGDTQNIEADFGDSPQMYSVNGQTVIGAGEKYTGTYSVLSALDGSLVAQNQAVPSCPFSEGLFADSAVGQGVVVVNGVNCDIPPSFPPTGEVVALSADTHARLWDLISPLAPVLSGVAIANGVAYFESSSLLSTLYAVDLQTGQVLSQVVISGGISGPSVSRGQVYIGTGTAFASGVATATGIVALGLD